MAWKSVCADVAGVANVVLLAECRGQQCANRWITNTGHNTETGGAFTSFNSMPLAWNFPTLASPHSDHFLSLSIET